MNCPHPAADQFGALPRVLPQDSLTHPTETEVS